jgi:hypothetical protein
MAPHVEQRQRRGQHGPTGLTTSAVLPRRTLGHRPGRRIEAKATQVHCKRPGINENEIYRNRELIFRTVHRV